VKKEKKVSTLAVMFKQGSCVETPYLVLPTLPSLSATAVGIGARGSLAVTLVDKADAFFMARNWFSRRLLAPVCLVNPSPERAPSSVPFFIVWLLVSRVDVGEVHKQP
jgi:hypothetical protein